MSKKIRNRIFAFFSAFIMFVSSCTSSSSNSTSAGTQLKKWMEDNGKLKVLCTTAMIADIVQQVGGEYIDALVLIQGNSDPHSYQLVKGDDEKFLRADLIFYNGLSLEHGPSLAAHLEKNPKAINLGDTIRRQSPNLILHVDGMADPHIWMDVSLWSKIVSPIVDAISKLRPEYEMQFESLGEQVMRKLQEAHQEIKALMRAIPEEKRYLVTSHDAFSYFTKQYLAEPSELNTEKWRDRCAAPEGLAPESQLSTQDIRRIIDHLYRFKISVIFPESNVSRDSIRKIVEAAREKGINVRIAPSTLYADAMGNVGSDADTYIKMIVHNARSIADELKDN